MWNQSIKRYMVMSMYKIIKNEFYKFFKNRKNLIIIALVFVYLFGINIFNGYKCKGYMMETSMLYVNKRYQAEAILGQDILTLEKEENLTVEEREELIEKTEFYKVEKNKLLVIEHNHRENNEEKYKHILIAEIERYNNIIRNIEEGVIPKEFLVDKGLTIEGMKKALILNQYILDNEIQPILNPYIMTGANSLKMFLEGNNLLVLILLIALLSIDIYLGEVEEGSYKLSYSQPFGRKELFLGKVITISFISLFLIVIGVLLNFIIMCLIYGVGDMNYPFIASSGAMEYRIIPLWKYAIMGFGLLLPILLLTISMIMSISILLDSSTKTLGISIMLLALALIFNNFLSKDSIVNLIYPYCYLFIDNVIEMKTKTNYLFGILFNSILTILLFLASYIAFIKKDFLGAKE